MRGTWVAASLVWWTVIAAGTARAETAPMPENTGETTLEELPGREKLESAMRRMEEAYMSGDAEKVTGILSASLSTYSREGVLRRLRREFAATKYDNFMLDTDQMSVLEGPVRSSGEGDAYQILVPCRYTYVSKNPGIGSMAGTHDCSHKFWMEWKDGTWGILESDLFATSGMSNIANQLGWLMFAGFIAVLVLAFWLWMSYHRLRSTRSAWKGLQLFLTTPVGAAVYFFRRYLQAPPEEDTDE